MKEIPLTQGYFALVEDSDYEWLSQFKWYAHVHRRKDGTIKAVYAERNILKTDGTQTPQGMHRLILGIKGVDHEDSNGLNNQRYNLRPATVVQNGDSRRLGTNSSSGFKGVSWSEGMQRWQARISVNGKSINLGYFVNNLDAYDAAALLHHGAFALTNSMLAERAAA
jgi:hypothetical protein